MIIVDPPWQDISYGIVDDKTINSSLSVQEVYDLKIEKLSKKGFLFLWIPNN